MGWQGPADGRGAWLMRTLRAPRGWAAAAACLLLAWLCTVSSPAGAAQVQRLERAEMAPGHASEPPQDGWRPVVLEERLRRERPAADGIGWYRFDFHLDEIPQRPLVLLVHRVVTTAEFRVNGSVLNEGVRFAVPGGRAGTPMLNWPCWYVLPAGLLHAGHNELVVRLAGNGTVGPYMSTPVIGPAEALRGEFLLREVVQRQMPEAITVLLAVGLVLAIIIWWRERGALQASMCVTTALWLALMLVYVFPDAPLSQTSYSSVVLVLWVSLHWALQDLLWRLSRSRWTWFPRVLAWGSAVPLVLALALMLIGPAEELLAVLMLPSLLLRVLTTAMLLRWVWQERSGPSVLLTTAEVLWFLGPVQTMLVSLNLLPGDPFMLMPGIGLPLVLAMFVLAARRLMQEREAAIRQREAAVLAERQRMMLDMHDGIGTHLAAAVHLARRDDVPRAQVGQIVQEALDDLHLIIDSLDPGVQALQPLLGQLRERTEPRLRALGHQLAWHIDDMAPYPLSAAQALDVLRFVQEAVGNAVRHAGARTIGIALATATGGCELRVFDDGSGFDPDADGGGPRGGRGLDSMRRRARRLGAQWALRRRAEGGTEVSLRLPHPRGLA